MVFLRPWKTILIIHIIAQYADMYAEKTKELLTQIDNLISLPEPQNKYINTEDIKKDTD